MRIHWSRGRPPVAAAPLPGDRVAPGLSWHVAWIAGLMILAMFAGVAGTLYQMRAAALKDARQAIATKGVAVAEQTTRAIQAADLVLTQIERQVASLATAGALSVDSYLESEAFHLSLAVSGRNLPQIDRLSVLDATGRVVTSSHVWPMPPRAFPDRDYFRFLRDHDDGGTFVSAPVPSQATGLATFYLARRINGYGHQFLGIVLCGIPLDYFETYFKAVARPEETIALFRKDSTLLTRYPARTDGIGQPAPAASAGEDSVQADDGGRRIVSVRPTAVYPLLVDVSLSQDAVLATWRHTAAIMASGAVFAAVCIALLGRRLAAQFRATERQHRGLVEAAAALTATRLQAEENAALFETTLTHMDEGLMLVDGSGHVVVCSNRAIELLGLPPALLATRPLYQEIGEYQRAHNEFSRTDPALAAAINNGLHDAPRIYERERPDGRVLEIRSTPLAGGGLVRTLTDITARRAAEALVRYQARHDELTGLANRMTCRHHLVQALDLSARSGRGLAFLYLDLDRFKIVNDTCGHPVGDKLLVAVADRIREEGRLSDMVARLGGDEFAIVLDPTESRSEAAALATRLVKAVSQPYVIEGKVIEIGLSIGIGLYPSDADSMASLVKCADAALYAAKRSGRSTFRFFDACDLAESDPENAHSNVVALRG